MKPEEFQHLVEHLRSLPRETEWFECKHNKAEPHDIGEYISALANGAALYGQQRAYILWGIEDKTFDIVGTTFNPHEVKVGNEELENWLLHKLRPRIDLRFHECVVSGSSLVLLEIPPAMQQPVSFDGREYIRIGSYKKKLKDHPEKESTLWNIFSQKHFEYEIAKTTVNQADVVSLIDYQTCFKLLGIPLPENQAAILDRLISEKIIIPRSTGHYDITNVGAVLFANDLGQFDRLKRKAPRVIIYKGNNRVQSVKEQEGIRGYAVGIEGLVSYINDQLPQNEQIDKVFRRQVRMYPEIAIRELVANCLIHQDFNLTGTGPMIELFKDRMEITNPGKPLVNTLRFIDESPQSRNETLARLMRRMNICEERGSGIDKVIDAVEAYQLPAPDFRVTDQHTVAVLYAPREFAQMDRQDRIRACYQHACLLYVSGKRMTNASLRERLGLNQKRYVLASRIIRDTQDEELIKQAGGSRKDASYVPFWAIL